MDEIKIDLLSKEEVNGTNSLFEGALDIFNNVGTSVYGTDLVEALSGGYDYSRAIRGIIKHYYFTKSPDNENDVIAISWSGSTDQVDRKDRRITIRPVLRLPQSLFEEIIVNKKKTIDGTYKVQYGEYPQLAPPKQTQDVLEEKYKEGLLSKTGRTYTFDSVRYDDYDSPFTPETYEEYEYENRKYIRVKVVPSEELVKYSTKVDYEYIWIEVSPIKWHIDFKSRSLVAERSLLAGIRFNDKEYYGDFESTEMYRYLNNYMLREMFQNEPNKKLSVELNEEIINETLDKIESQLSDKNLSKDELESLEEALINIRTESKKR